MSMKFADRCTYCSYYGCHVIGTWRIRTIKVGLGERILQDIVQVPIHDIVTFTSAISSLAA